jgi:predicted RND superfamily exporter protein
MSEILRKYAEHIVRHPWRVLILSLAATAAVASGMSRLTVNLDLEQQLPADHPYVIVDRTVRKEFGGRNFVAIALVPASGTIWSPEVLRVVHSMTLDLLNAPGVIRQNVASLSSPYVRVPRDHGGTLTSDYLMKEPPEDAAAVAAVRELYESEPLFKGSVVSDDERAVLVLADFYENTGDEVAATVEAIVAKYRAPGLTIALTGEPIFRHFESRIVANQGYYFLGTVAAVLCALWLAFGQFQGVILPSVTALLSTAVAMGFMGYTGIPMNAWTASVPLIVVSVAAGHSAQMLKRYYEEYARCRDRGMAVIESTAHIGMVMMAAGVTAGSGFAALAVLGIPTLAQFGLGVACGIFAAVVLEMSFMLALRAIWPVDRTATGEGPLSRWLGALLRPLAAAVIAAPWRVVLAFLAIAVAAIAGYPRLTSDIDAKTYWSEQSRIGHDLRIFERHFPSTITLTVLLEGPPGSMRTPEAIAVMTGLQQAMAADPDVGRTSSVADIVRRTYEVFSPEDAGTPMPMDSALIGQLFMLADSPAFERYIDRAATRAVVLGFLNRDDTAVTRRVMARLEDHVRRHPSPTIRVLLAGGVGPTVLALNEHTVRGKVLNIAVVFAVIFTVASVLLRTPVGGAYVTAPLAMTLIVNLGLLAWSRVAFDMTGASIAAVGVSIGADYAIYALYRLREEQQRQASIEEALRVMMETTGRAVLFVALAISAGFAVYLISDFYGFHILGVFVPLTMVTSSMTALTLLPALVLLLRPAFVMRPAGARVAGVTGPVAARDAGGNARRAEGRAR